MISTSYLSDVYEPKKFTKAVSTVVRDIKALRKRKAFDSIAFTGQSGSAFAYAVAARTGIPLTCVRKKGSSSHFAGKRGGVEGKIPKKYIIIDDFIETGATISNITTAVDVECIDVHRREAKCVAIYLYSPIYGGSKYDKDFNGIPIIRRKRARS